MDVRLRLDGFLSCLCRKGDNVTCLDLPDKQLPLVLQDRVVGTCENNRTIKSRGKALLEQYEKV